MLCGQGEDPGSAGQRVSGGGVLQAPRWPLQMGEGFLRVPVSHPPSLCPPQRPPWPRPPHRPALQCRTAPPRGPGSSHVFLSSASPRERELVGVRAPGPCPATCLTPSQRRPSRRLLSGQSGPRVLDKEGLSIPDRGPSTTGAVQTPHAEEATEGPEACSPAPHAGPRLFGGRQPCCCSQTGVHGARGLGRVAKRGRGCLQTQEGAPAGLLHIKVPHSRPQRGRGPATPPP